VHVCQTNILMLCAFFWVIPRRLNFICRRFGTLCLFHLHICLRRWNRQYSETSAYKLQTPGNYPEENIQYSEHGEILKSRIVFLIFTMSSACFEPEVSSSARRLYVQVWYSVFYMLILFFSVTSASKHTFYLICIIGTVFKDLHSRRNIRLLSRYKRETRALLEFYAAYNASSVPTFRQNLSAKSSSIKQSILLDPWRWDL
jgi:hypothetical protein